MLSVGIKVLKNKLSEYVRLAAAGETVLISDRDHVVAELVPPSETRARQLPDAILAEAIRNGYISPAAAPSGIPARTRSPKKLREILDDLDTDRQDR